MLQLTKHEIEAMDVAKHFDDSDTVYKYAPSLFAKSPHPKMSGRYAFTNTYDILLHMHNRGFKVTSVQGGSRLYNKAMVRMRNNRYDVRDGAPEVVIVDSHDGTSALKMYLGFIRFVCMNGMVCGDMFYAKSFMHRAPDLMAQVMLELEDMDVHVNKLNQRVDTMRAFQTTLAQRIVLADAAVKARYGDEKDGSFVADMRHKLLQIRRDADNDNNMYTVMNVVQENVLRGGMTYVSNNRVLNLQPISEVRRSVNINQTLWNTAEELIAKAA